MNAKAGRGSVVIQLTGSEKSSNSTTFCALQAKMANCGFVKKKFWIRKQYTNLNISQTAETFLKWSYPKTVYPAKFSQ